MFSVGQYYYCVKSPCWIEIIDVDPDCVVFMKHRIDTGMVEKDWWTAMSLPIPFNKRYVEANSEGEALLGAFEAMCDENLSNLDRYLNYISEPLVTVKMRVSDVKGLERYIVEYV